MQIGEKTTITLCSRKANSMAASKETSLQKIIVFYDRIMIYS